MTGAHLIVKFGWAFVLCAAVAAFASCDPAGQTPQTAPGPSASATAAPKRSDVAAANWTDEFVSPDGEWRLRYRTTPDPIQRNALCVLDVELISADPRIAIIGVAARMPEHQHGTTLLAELQALGDGRYRVEGLLLHMSGFWELFFTVERGARTQRARFEIVMP